MGVMTFIMIFISLRLHSYPFVVMYTITLYVNIIIKVMTPITVNVIMKYLVSSLCSATRSSIGGKIFDKNTFSSIHYKTDNLTEMVSAKKKIPAWCDGTPSHSLSSFLPLSLSLHTTHCTLITIVVSIMHLTVMKTIIIIMQFNSYVQSYTGWH